MARPLRIDFPGAFYHVTSRGDEKCVIFKSARDRLKFLEYLASTVDRHGAVIHGYCLMTNHYHLLLETPHANLSQILHLLNGSYTTYFNVKRKRAGHLFQGRFKAILVEADQYALELSRYMHLNPVRAGMTKEPATYQWSSYLAYIGKIPEPAWLTCRFIRGLLCQSSEAANRYREFVEDLLGKEYVSPLAGAVACAVLGSPDFIEEIMADYVDNERARPDLPAVKALHHRYGIENIISKVHEKGLEPQLARQVAIHLCHRYSGARLSEIGGYFELSYSGVSKVSTKLEKLLMSNSELQFIVREILRELGRGKFKL